MQKRRVRADPVSCQSCRTKKLKCSRVQPCANCTTRGLDCVFLVAPTTRTGSSSGGFDELLKRIEKLEALVSSRGDHSSTSTLSGPGSEANGASTVLSNRNWETFESLATTDLSPLPMTSNHLSFHVLDPAEILCRRDVCGSRCLLPTYTVAELLFDNFETHLDHVCRILHNPSIRTLIKSLYLQLHRHETILASEAALLLSIFALSAYFFPVHVSSEVACTSEDATHLSMVWSRSALDCLDYSQRTTSGSLADAQAYILMSYVTYHVEGPSARGRRFCAAAASIALDLGLHRLDASESPPEKEYGFGDLIMQEVKRRVFWHIVATDWLQSTVSGPQEGIYTIHPSHIQTKVPQDCNDDMIFDCDSALGLVPTSMTFFLARVQLAHFCREMTDLVPPESKLMQFPYDHIVTLDKKFLDHLSRLPYFLKDDPDSRERSKVPETVYTKIPILRYCILTAIHSRRCRLHQRFLLRQSSEPRYSYSRQACLESARAVLHLYSGHRLGSHTPTMSSARMGMAVHFTHLALVVLVMDLCIAGDQTLERKTEVLAGLRLLEEASHMYPQASQYMRSLKEVMQRYKVQLDDQDTAITLSHGTQTPVGTTALGTVRMFGSDMGIDPDMFPVLASEEETDDADVWDTFFASLDTRPF